MKTIRSKSGPFAERPHFSPGEIDRVCAEELRRAGCYPPTPEPVRIDRFIEKRFGVTPQYEELPDGILGFTRFGSNGVEGIVVAAALDAEETVVAERRIRTTLAHEAGHGLLHAYLFALGVNPPTLFSNDSADAHRILCRDVQPQTQKRTGYDGRWWEFQANRAIGGLLMPRPLVEEAVKPYLRPHGSLGVHSLDREQEGEAVRALTGIFDVNPVVARIRLGDIFPERNDRQLQL